MKVIIWAKKDEVISGNITKWFNRNPDTSDDHLMVELTTDEFVQLEDKCNEDKWIVDQYNRNRDISNHINDASDIQDDYDNQPFGD